MDDGIVIEHGLPPELRDQAVEVFEEAFGEKMRMAVRDAGKRKAFMRRAYVAENCLVARRGPTLLGMAGLSTRGRPYDGGLMGASWDFRPYRDLLGWFGAIWAVWGNRMADHRPKADEVYVDGIAVSPGARGLGIGTRLLDETTAIARDLGKPFVRLDVIDTNPRAQALYERLGFRVTKVQSFRYLERLAGFGGMVSMELPVTPLPDVRTAAPRAER
ncbi:MAG: GNAT family N-acetyltransferase [Candidatus Limnocylindrales bacterium]